MPVATAEASAVAVIPARYASKRLPGKPLVDLGGMPMIERVYRQTRQAKRILRTIVATDDERIRTAMARVGEVVMTEVEHESGSDRVAEVARTLDCDIVVNVQGDIPLLDPRMIDALVAALDRDPDAGIATAAVAVRSTDELDDPSIVKVVCDLRGRALYFSRAPIPWERDAPGSVNAALHHVGLYAYRRDVLLRFAELEPTPLERTEKLEQLRALENGIPIAVVACDGAPPHAVDTPNDLEAVRQAISGLEPEV
jgi:3-deoxy-manno-octulosonate cytidylyltransferase (CMP-KDO synthetase)